MRAGRRRRPDHPLELPAADAGLEDRARAGGWATRSCSSPPSSRSITALPSPRSCQRVGLPPGVVNIVTGDGRTGDALVSHPDVDKIAFTGSTEVGRIIRRATAGTGKRLSLELGGKSPFVVFDDADLDSVVEGVVDAIWFNQGQVCCAGSRLLVQESVADCAAGQARARAWRSCASATRWTRRSTSARSSRRCSWRRFTRLVQQGVDEGARMWQPSWACPTDGYFFPPTLFTDVSPAVDHRAGGDLRPGARRDDLPHARRGGGAGQQHRATAWPPASGARTSTCAGCGAQDQGRHGLGQLHQRLRRRLRLRRLPRERLWPRGRPRGSVRVRRVRRGRHAGHTEPDMHRSRASSANGTGKGRKKKTTEAALELCPQRPRDQRA